MQLHLKPERSKQTIKQLSRVDKENTENNKLQERKCGDFCTH